LLALLFIICACNIPDVWNKISKYLIQEFVENIIDKQREKRRDGKGKIYVMLQQSYTMKLL